MAAKASEKYARLDKSILAAVSNTPVLFAKLLTGEIQAECQRLAKIESTGSTYQPFRVLDRRLQALRKAGHIKSTPKGWVKQRPDNINAELARIVELNDFSRMIHSPRHPQKGQFVVAGPNFRGDLARVGYCVQIRRSVGQFGSDIVFLRHADGSLIVHENNCYCGMTQEQEGIARAVFVALPEEEDYESGYSDCEKVHETGFLIEHSSSRGTPDASFTIAITSGGGGNDV